MSVWDFDFVGSEEAKGRVILLANKSGEIVGYSNFGSKESYGEMVRLVRN